MSVSISETPNLHIIAGGAVDLIQKLKDRTDHIVAAVDQAPAVAEALEKLNATNEYVGKLKRARTALNQRSADLFNALRGSQEELENRLIERGIETGQTECGDIVRELLFMRAEEQAVSRALENVTIHKLAMAEIAELDARANYFSARGDELRRVAQERIEKTTALMQEAVEHEGAVLLDTRYTLSGELMKLAVEAGGDADRARRQANDARRMYGERTTALATNTVTRRG